MENIINPTKRIITLLKNFKFSISHQKKPFNISWLVIEVDENGNKSSRGFNLEEENKFIKFTLNNELNFSGPKQSHNFQDGDEEYFTIPKVVSEPRSFILKRSYTKSMPGTIQDPMDIQLTDNNGVPCHNYDLDFDVIGTISRL